MGAFTDGEGAIFYQEAYKNTKPGDWIEQIEWSIK